MVGAGEGKERSQQPAGRFENNLGRKKTVVDKRLAVKGKEPLPG